MKNKKINLDGYSGDDLEALSKPFLEEFQARSLSPPDALNELEKRMEEGTIPELAAEFMHRMFSLANMFAEKPTPVIDLSKIDPQDDDAIKREISRALAPSFGRTLQ